MQMPRFFEGSISATIRYYGAKRDFAGRVVDDTIADELKHAMGGVTDVVPGTVVVTGAGELGTPTASRRSYMSRPWKGRSIAAIGRSPV